MCSSSTVATKPPGFWTWLKAGRGGTFNVAGPARRFRFAELLGRCRGPVTWVPDPFLLDEGVQPYTEMPLWLPASLGNLNMPIERALTAGLRHRDVDETLRDTRAWAESLDGAVSQIDAGGRVRRSTAMTPEREAALLERWRARAG